jgi:hypothetical protein
LGEPARWIGRQLPLVLAGGLVWLDLFWRRDTAANKRQCENFLLAARLTLPRLGRVDIRGRLEGARIDVVMETARRLPRIMSADLSDAFTSLLPRLRLQGSLTLRHSHQAHET